MTLHVEYTTKGLVSKAVDIEDEHATKLYVHGKEHRSWALLKSAIELETNEPIRKIDKICYKPDSKAKDTKEGLEITDLLMGRMLPTIRRCDVSTYINLSREAGQCRRCVNELMDLSIYRYDDEEWKLIQDCMSMLDRKTRELHHEKRELDRTFFGNLDKKLDKYFDGGDE